MPISLAFLDDLVATPPSQVCFMTGAGISIAPPTCLPSGDALTRAACEWAFEPGTLNAITDIYRRLDIAKSLPRLEVVLGIASDTDAHGAMALEAMLDPLRGAPPNALHSFFAQHLSAGGRHVTANFDTCIERSAAPAASTHPVIHFHGSIDDSLTSLGAVFRNVEHGFSPAMAATMDEALRDTAWLVVLGYSGSDVFDVAPWMRDLALRKLSMRGRMVVWVRHDPSMAPTEVRDVADRSALDGVDLEVRDFLDEEARDWAWQQREWLRQAGAHVAVVVGDSRQIIDQLAQGWGLSTAPVPTIAAAPAPATRASAAGVTRATAQLWSHLGYLPAALEVIDRQPDLFERRFVDEVRAARLWQMGRYSAARRTWATARPRVTEAEEAEWIERQVACRWVAGSLLRAAVEAERAWRRQRRAGIVNGDLIEVWLRCLDHMRRSPDLFWYTAMRRRTALAAADLALRSGSLGEHGRIRLASAALRLTSRRATTGEQLLDARARFMQSESLSGVINYRHGRANASADLGRPFYERLRRWHLELGSVADASRVCVTPNATRHYSPLEQWSAFRGIDFSTWHKVRMVGRAAFDRFRLRWR